MSKDEEGALFTLKEYASADSDLKVAISRMLDDMKIYDIEKE